MAKVVSNLLSDISKARDLIARGDIREINNKSVIFDRISRAVKTQLSLYIKNSAHELDFNHEDLNELSTEVFEYIKNFQQRFTKDNTNNKRHLYRFFCKDWYRVCSTY